MPDCFCYGTLQSSLVLSKVLNGVVAPLDNRLKLTKAELHGYRRHALENRKYPGIVEDPLGIVQGTLVENLTEYEMGRLGSFEGDEYSLTSVNVSVDGLPKQNVFVFVWKEHSTLLEKDWSLSDFETQAAPWVDEHMKLMV